MSHTYLPQIKKGILLPGGLRKKCFLVKEKSLKKIFCLWPVACLPKKRILYSIKVDFDVGKIRFPVRKWQKIGSGYLKKITYNGNKFWLGIGSYLPGKICSNWTSEYLSAAGRELAKLHQHFVTSSGKTLLHGDFARGNILFNKRKKVCGILDFEEAVWGEPEKDIACSLSFMVMDTPGLNPQMVFKYFLKGYNNQGGKFDKDKINKYFWEYMGIRRREGDRQACPPARQAFLLLAKKKLNNYRERVKSKILKKEDLKTFAKKNKSKNIVFNVGAYELLNWGHLEFLKKAKAAGNLLVVGVASDESRRRLKGDPHPMITDRTRAETLAHFGFVDGVVIASEDNVVEELKELKPKIFWTVRQDWREGIRHKEEKELLNKWKGKIVFAPYLSPSVSSSQMVEKVAQLKIQQLLNGKTRRQPILKLRRARKNPKEIKYSQLAKLSKRLHQDRKTIVFASGTADLFHLGHARFYQKAKSLADVLVVGVPSNASVTALKGPGRPMVDEKARAWVMADLDWVDYVVIFDERTVLGCLKKLKPDVFFTVREDWNQGFLDSSEARFIKSIGSKIVRSEKQSPYLSASKMIDKAAGTLVQKKFSEIMRVAQRTPVLDADGFDPHSSFVQLAAREKGFYDQVLEEVTKRGKCVFCDLKGKYLVEEKNGVVLTVALFPYNDGHLLIIPRRHVEQLTQLNRAEKESVLDLCIEAEKILKEKLGVKNVWLILREGEGIKAGKTVTHLHFHLMPYDPNVIKMADQKLATTPLEMAKKLRGEK